MSKRAASNERDDEMNHSEATQQMTAERYLLDELAPQEREAFEEHLFDCPECALDLRVGNAFVKEAKAQLPWIADQAPAVRPAETKPSFWQTLFRPALVAPAFGLLLAVVAFQNVVTFPALRRQADQPQVMALTHLRPPTRGASHQTLTADPVRGVALQIDLSVESAQASPASYAVKFRNAAGGEILSKTVSVADDQQLSVQIPGAGLRNGTYSLAIAGVGPHGEQNPVAEYVFDIVVTNQ
jgi:hypothetical protein